MYGLLQVSFFMLVLTFYTISPIVTTLTLFHGESPEGSYSYIVMYFI